MKWISWIQYEMDGSLPNSICQVNTTEEVAIKTQQFNSKPQHGTLMEACWVQYTISTQWIKWQWKHENSTPNNSTTDHRMLEMRWKARTHNWSTWIMHNQGYCIFQTTYSNTSNIPTCPTSSEIKQMPFPLLQRPFMQLQQQYTDGL